MFKKYPMMFGFFGGGNFIIHVFNSFREKLKTFITKFFYAIATQANLIYHTYVNTIISAVLKKTQ